MLQSTPSGSCAGSWGLLTAGSTPGGVRPQRELNALSGVAGSGPRSGRSSSRARGATARLGSMPSWKPAAFAPRSARSPSSCERTAFVHREAGGGRRSPPTAATPMRSRPICSTATSKPLRPMRSGSLTSPTSQLTKAGSTSPPSRIWPRWRSSAGRCPSG